MEPPRHTNRNNGWQNLLVSGGNVESPKSRIKTTLFPTGKYAVKAGPPFIIKMLVYNIVSMQGYNY